MSDQTILIDLDALLDTRLGALSQIDSEVAVKIMKNGYWERTEDNFAVLSKNLITDDHFKTQYGLRDVTTLAASVLTKVVDVIGPITRELQQKQAARVEIGDIRLIVNIAPYQLDDEEVKAILEALRPYVALNTKLEAVEVAQDKLTPQQLDQLCDLYVTYDYNGWIGHHHEALLSNPIPMMTILAPMIMYNKVSIDEADLVDPETGMHRDPFRLHQMIMAEFIALEFHPAFVFSMVH